MTANNNRGGQPHWSDKYFASQSLRQRFRGKLNDYFGRRFGPDVIAGFQQDLEGLLWERLQRLDPQKADNEAYVWTIFSNLVVDRYRQLYGRHHIPVVVERLGRFAVRIWELFCLEKASAETIEEVLKRKVLLEEIERKLAVLREQRACPDKLRKVDVEQSLTGVGDDPDAMTDVPDEARDYRSLEVDEIQKLLALVLGWTGDQRQAALAGMSQRVADHYDAIRAALAFTDDDYLLLRMIYQDGLNRREVSDALGEKYHTVRNRLSRLGKRIRDAFASQGIALELFRD